MAELLRISNTNEISENKGVALGLEGNLFIGPVVGVVLFPLIYVVTTAIRLPLWSCFVISSAPLAVITAVCYLFLNNKPPHYIDDAVSKVLEGPETIPSTLESKDAPPKLSSSRFRDCWFADDLIIFNDADSRGFASKGFVLTPPAFSSLSVQALNDICTKLMGFLLNVKAPVAVQFQWDLNSDYVRELNEYDKTTRERCEKGSLSEAVRSDRFRHYMSLQDNGTLRRETLRVYFSLKLESTIQDEKELDSISTRLSSYGTSLSSIFSQYNCQITPMTAENHFRHYLELLNPDLSRPALDAIKFDPAQSALEQCMSSTIVDFAEGGFFMGGMYHDILMIKSPPADLYPGMINQLLSLTLSGFSVAVNLRPIDLAAERKKTESEIERLEGDMAAVKSSKYSLQVARDRKVSKVYELADGRVNPFRCEYVIRVNADTREELHRKVRAIRQSISLTNGCVAWDFSGGRSARNLFFQTLPGWCFGDYSKFAFYGDNNVIAPLLPFSSTFTGRMNSEIEALYDGNNGGLVSFATFHGGSPQHCLVLGTTGCGKSALWIDLLAQTEPYYDFTCLIEEGLSYSVYSLAHGVEPIVFHPDAPFTINYLDLNGLPLSATHISFCVALLMNMIGFEGNRGDHDREAILSRYLRDFYNEIFETYRKDNEASVLQIARLCVFTERETGLLDDFTHRFLEIKRLFDAADKQIMEDVAKLSESELTAYLHNPSKLFRVQQCSFTVIPAKSLCDHSTFVEFMRLNEYPEHDPKEVGRLITTLADWDRTSRYGCLFDGQTNIELQGELVHFELGQIPDTAGTLKTMVGFLILNLVRQHIISLPRAVRKRFVFEEAAKFLSLKSGEEVFKECYAQMRKFNTWVASINQNYSLFKNSPVKGVVMSNSKQFVLMRQTDKEDVADFSKTIELPESSASSVLEFPLPEGLPPEKRYSSFLYHYAGQNMFFGGVVHNVPGPESLFCASTSAKDFDDAKKYFDDARDTDEKPMETIRRAIREKETAKCIK